MENGNYAGLEEKIFSVSDSVSFEKTALEVFFFQREHCEVYRSFVNALGRPDPRNLYEIPFLPIQFFKEHEIRSFTRDVDTVFMSSGTTGMIRSSHYVESLSMYERSFFPTYKAQIGNPEEQVIIALLPNYIEQGQSSLVYMVDQLIQSTKNPLSGFYLHHPEQVISAYQKASSLNKQVVIFGVSYALLDLAEAAPDFSSAIIIETGGMKGRRKEMSKDELHQILKDSFNVPYIASEYGMCELLSQAYSREDGLFGFPAWMKALIREVNDPFEYIFDGKTGGINVIDLANLYACSFISTQDLGKQEHGLIKLMGRFDHSDIRGCNLLIS